MPDFYGNSPTAVILAASLSGGVLLLVWVTRAVIRHGLRHAKETESELDDFFYDGAQRTKIWLLLIPAIFLGARALRIADELYRPLRVLAHLTFISQAALWAAGLADFWLRRYRKTRIEHDPASQMTVNIFRIAIVSAVWIVAALVALENLGFNIMTIVAGLGIGGVAVALAMQNILGDLFASLSIVIDKPFVIGDAIQVDEISGTVEHVGLKTTRIRSVTGEEVVFSNGDLLKSRIRNFKRMTERRALIRVIVDHATAPEKLERVPLLLRAAIEKHEQTRFDRAHFVNLGETGFEYEAVYYVRSPEFGLFADTRQTVLLDVMRGLASEEIALTTSNVARGPRA